MKYRSQSSKTVKNQEKLKNLLTQNTQNLGHDKTVFPVPNASMLEVTRKLQVRIFLSSVMKKKPNKSTTS